MSWVWVEDEESPCWGVELFEGPLALVDEGSATRWQRELVRDVVITVAAEATRAAIDLVVDRVQNRCGGWS